MTEFGPYTKFQVGDKVRYVPAAAQILHMILNKTGVIKEHKPNQYFAYHVAWENGHGLPMREIELVLVEENK